MSPFDATTRTGDEYGCAKQIPRVKDWRSGYASCENMTPTLDPIISNPSGVNLRCQTTWKGSGEMFGN
jgi:hypothetical protein